ncbi:hypothetical protein ELUMI_v1c04960 [Williamsoniiplasma luminosum]|uniref:Uncharacterized protein n=1 Tax=Williamsoniiplasma luminosum TaxID=214888 RepID=A0A2K8NTQ4_9MOLU|nr:hypothetical protein [Williamsoniiplasma luminosum]ATZ17220.1 hypothetical protein ELUMI_v1c04960 [Williamsoniiplasma luminosum]
MIKPILKFYSLFGWIGEKIGKFFKGIKKLFTFNFQNKKTNIKSLEPIPQTPKVSYASKAHIQESAARLGLGHDMTSTALINQTLNNLKNETIINNNVMPNMQKHLDSQTNVCQNMKNVVVNNNSTSSEPTFKPIGDIASEDNGMEMK